MSKQQLRQRSQQINQLYGKRFLITQPIIRNFTGSIVVTLELAAYLQSQGAEVTVYTAFYDQPVKTAFENVNIKVTSSKEEPNFALQDFDYIWVHSQILPYSIVRRLNELSKSSTRFIFLHMSPHHVLAPDEFPWIYQLEDKLTNLRLVISEETASAQNQYLNFSPTLFFRNPAPVEFCEIERVPSKTLKKVLVVTNHPPVELDETIAILREQHPEVMIETFGETFDWQKVITASELKKYDAIITIGKTVQYGLVAGIPVFVYDKFGGFGYLNKGNYEVAKRQNFSGRGGNKLTAREIVNRLIDEYVPARQFALDHRPDFIDTYSIDNVVPQIIQSVPERCRIDFSSEYIKALLAAQRIAHEFFQALGMSRNFYERANSDIDALQADISALQANVAEHQQVIKALERDIDSLHHQLRKEAESSRDLDQALQTIRSKYLYRIARKLKLLP